MREIKIGWLIYRDAKKKEIYARFKPPHFIFPRQVD
jgi:hypothetical protein